MHSKKQYSDEHLNAFIDNQLDTTEKAAILDAIRHDAELSQRVCTLQKLHNLVQLTYQSVEVPEHHKGTRTPTKETKYRWGVVASFFLVFGAIAGWLSNQAMNPNSLLDIAQVTHSPDHINNTKSWNLMLHVSTADPRRLNIVLNEAESLLAEYAKSSLKLNLEILTNQEGLTLVTNNGKAYNTRLQNLQQKYANLAVMVCGETLNKIQDAQGKKLKLLPNTKIVPSAISQIADRQKNGWSYIRI
ncbi:MAG: DsrE family protein [Gammaproteobacteria bacterium]|nr:DsrE family protein [Gammaproteobacteria bacterium]MCW8986983.1 DsrE family protein [Gammaproteobacteria bacterium]MCW9031751.1 DsrE family protein [Gammaproteobacteria bacterium]